MNRSEIERKIVELMWGATYTELYRVYVILRAMRQAGGK